MYFKASLRFTYYLLLIFLFFTNPLFSQSFSGYVTDANTGFPIQNAIISVGNGLSPEYFDTTNIQGYYELNGLPDTNDYTILATAPAFISQDVIMKSPPDNIDFILTRPYTGTFVSTTYHGNILYHSNGSYFERYDGVSEQDTVFFPLIDAQSDTISMLLDSIGAGVDTTTNDTLIWNKTCILWDWLIANAYFDLDDPSWQTAFAFMMSQGIPSIEQISRTYLIYGFIPWGVCNSRAQIFTTLLYRIGLSKHKIAIAETKWQFRYSQHWYSIIFLNKRWISIDPSYNTPWSQSLPGYSNYKSYPRPGPTITKDYPHPHKTLSIPGSSINCVPEISFRKMNYIKMFMYSPPDLSISYTEYVKISGISKQSIYNKVYLNNIACSVINDYFEGVVPLDFGWNTIKATFAPNGSIMDSLRIFKDSTKYLNIRINEFMAINSSTYTDPAGEYDDWIEIYNASEDTVNIAGYYLSSDTTTGTRYCISNQFPDSTSILPYDFLVLWADGNTNQGVRHLNFTLPDDTGNLYFYHPDNFTMLESIAYGQQYNDTSYGRFPDGDTSWFLMPSPTPGQSNTISPKFLVLQNDTIHEGETSCYDATNTVTIAGNGTSFVIDSAGTLTIIAGENIMLMPGFWAKHGSNFYGYISKTGCSIILASSIPTTNKIAITIEEPAENGINLDDVFHYDNLLIFPNPTSNRFNIHFKSDYNSTSSHHVSLYDLFGRQIYSKVFEGNSVQVIDVSSYSNGIYIIQVISDAGVFSEKVIKY